MDQVTVTQYIDSILGEASYLMPEFTLCLGAFLLLVVELIKPAHASSIKTNVTLSTLLISGLSVTFFAFDGEFFNGYLQQTALIRLIKVLVLFVGFFTLLFPKSKINKRSEYPFLIIMILLGAMILIQAHNLLVFYLSLELMSISSYILITFSFNQRGFEGGMKYLLFGALASGLMLYGISLLYGLSGTFTLPELSGFTPSFANAEYWWVLGMMLFLVGFLFKLSLIPFHIWTPDVYESAPASVIAFISIVPKVAVFMFLFKISSMVMQGPIWQWLLSVVALASIFFGNLSALRQDNMQRMMAYSTIAHSGTMLIAIIVGNQFGLQSLVFYLFVYTVMNVLGFYLIRIFELNDAGAMSGLTGFRGGKTVLFAVVVAMLALTGLPPTGGFTAKILVFTGLWESYSQDANTFLMWLFVLGLVNSAISLFYYLKIPYFLIIKKEPETVDLKVSVRQKIYLLFFSFAILVAFFKADILFEIINQSCQGQF